MLCFTLYLRAIFQVQAPRGLIFGGVIFKEGFLPYWFGGLIHVGAYFQNFTVSLHGHVIGVVTHTMVKVISHGEKSHGKFTMVTWLHTNQSPR